MKLDKDELSAESEINWDIGEETVEVNGNGIANGSAQLLSKALDEPNNAGGSKVARGEEAQSLLLCSQYRNRFINELIEVSVLELGTQSIQAAPKPYLSFLQVESFLSERLQEMKTEHMLSSHLFQSAPSVLQLTTADGVREMLAQVVAIRQAFEVASLKVLYYMKDSPK